MSERKGSRLLSGGNRTSGLEDSTTTYQSYEVFPSSNRWSNEVPPGFWHWQLQRLDC